MRPGKGSETYRTWSGGGEKQIAHGAPGANVPAARIASPAYRRSPAWPRRHGRVDSELSLKAPLPVEYLNAAVAAVGDIDQAHCIDRDAVRRVELARAGPALAPGFEPVAVQSPSMAQEPIKTRSGTVRITDSNNLPASKTIAAALVEVEPGGMRELHWHPNAA